MVCYDSSSPTSNGHSTAVGVALDGYVIYGKDETTGQKPCNLDACHGHVGPVPTDATYGIAGTGSVYHYHTSDYDTYPFTCELLNGRRLADTNTLLTVPLLSILQGLSDVLEIQ